MQTRLNREWQVFLPEEMVRRAGFAAGEKLSCRAEQGVVSLCAGELAEFSGGKK